MMNNQTNKEKMNRLPYHFFISTRYGRKVFRNTNIQQRFKEILASICDEFNFELIEVKLGDNYAQISLTTTPNWSPEKVLAKIRVRSSNLIRKEFQELNHLPSLWVRPFLVTNGDHPLDITTALEWFGIEEQQ